MKNKKIIALFIACLLIFVAVISNVVAKKPSKEKVIYVDCDYNNPKKPSDGSRGYPYTTIQQGIDAASPGYTVFVFNGIYSENVVVDKSINLVGENKSSTIIDGIVGENVVYITADWVKMSGFNIQSVIDGIRLYYSNHSTIIGNNLLNSFDQDGISLWYSNYNIVTCNDVSDNGESGIQLGHSSYNIISNNKVTGNNDYGIDLFSGSNYNTITGNNVNENLFGNICLWDSNNNIILGNNVSNCSGGYGIKLNSCSYNTITSNILINSDWAGIILSSSSYNIIYNNFFNNSLYSWNKNVIDDGNNIWYISKTPGTNIVGGNYLGGNYWSDYTWIDADGDGLGDIPYNIPGGINQDLYPLMIP